MTDNYGIDATTLETAAKRGVEGAAPGMDLGEFAAILPYTERLIRAALPVLIPAIEKPLRDQIARLQAAVRWYDDGENTDAAIEIMCWETLQRGDMATEEATS